MNLEQLVKIIDEELPVENEDSSESPEQLLIDLEHFGLSVIEKLRVLIKKHLYGVILKDARKREEVKSKYKIKVDPSSPANKRGYWNRCQLIEQMLISEKGFAASSYFNRRDPISMKAAEIPIYLEPGFFLQPGNVTSERPSFLYKYLTPDSTIAVLKNNSLKFSSPLLFDDIFDVYDLKYEIKKKELTDALSHRQYRIAKGELPSQSVEDTLVSMAFSMREKNRGSQSFEDFCSHNGKAIEADVELHLEQFLRMEKDWQYLARYMRILCLSSNPLNNNMWGVYAGCNTGAVLEFALNTEWIVFNNISPVQYSDSPPSMETAEEWAKNYRSKGNNGGTDLKTLYSLIYSKSSKDWGYQKEWRTGFLRRDWLTDGLENHAENTFFDYINFPREILKKVIFGKKSTPEFITKIVSLTRSYKDVEFYQCEKIDGTYDLGMNKLLIN